MYLSLCSQVQQHVFIALSAFFLTVPFCAAAFTFIALLSAQVRVKTVSGSENSNDESQTQIQTECAVMTCAPNLTDWQTDGECDGA